MEAPQQPAAAEDATSTYWATLPLDQLVDELKGQERGWWAAGQRRGYWQLLRLMYAQSQGMDPGSGQANTTQQLTFVGKNAGFVRFRVQLARSHIRQRNIMAQGERVAFQCLALNDDFASLSQVPTAQAGLDYVFRAAKGEHVKWQALDADGYFGEGAIWVRWDSEAGKEIEVTEEEEIIDEATGEPMMLPSQASEDPNTGETVIEPEQPATRTVKRRKKAGTPTLAALFPWEVVRDPYAKKCPWVIVREIISKHEVAARFPEKANQILAVDNLRTEAGIAEMFAYDMGAATTDQIIVRHFYHEDSPACPGGRYVGVAGDIPLWDEPNPLPEGNPIAYVCSAKYFGTAFGYPECSDLLSLQEMIDELLTQAANNILRYGNQSLWAEDGVEVDMKKLAQGGGFFNYKTGQKPPQTIQWAELPTSVQYMLEFLIERMNEISGMNSVARGAPEANISSGAFAALLLNVAQKYVSATEQTANDAMESIGNMLLAFLHANAETEFVGVVAGNNQSPYSRSFKGSDFKGIERVQVTTISALMRTIPGRFEVFNAIKDLSKPDRSAAIQLFNTGDPSGFTQADQSESLLIQWENEQLAQGIWCEPDNTDDPIMHCRGHKAMRDRIRTMPAQLDEMGNPTPIEEARIKSLMMLGEHIAKHAINWVMADPIILDTLQLPRPANPMAPGATLPTPPALTEAALNPPPGAGAPPSAPNSNLPEPADPAGPPDEAQGDFAAEAAE